MESTQLKINFATSEDVKTEEVVKYEESSDLPMLPKILDEKYFSPSNDLLLTLEDFNSRYNCNLSVQNSGKWAVGTYNVVKDMLTTQMFPHWFTKNGANSIHKFTKYNTWTYDRCMKDLQEINHKLYQIRQGNIKLFSQETIEEGTAWIEKFNKKLQKSLKRVEAHACFTNTPYFDRNNISKYKYMPVIYDADCVEEDYLGNLYAQDPNHMEECADKDLLYQPHDDMSKPKAWYFNILIPLKDISINIYRPKKNGEGYDLVDTLPWGDLVVGFTFNVLELFKMNLVAHDVKKLAKFTHTAKISQYTYSFPDWFSWQHPFVSWRQNDLPLRFGDFSRYDMGNTCFGDFKYEILQQIVLGNIHFAKTILDKWASTFILHQTSPLNGYTTFNFGLTQKQKDSGMGAETALCERTTEGFNTERMKEFQAEMCEGKGCVIKSKCDIYRTLNKSQHEFNYIKNEDIDELKMLGPWKDVYEALTLYCDTVGDVYNYFHISTDNIGDYPEDEYLKVFQAYINPVHWNQDGKLGVPYFVNYVLPTMERIYVLSNIKRESHDAFKLQVSLSRNGNAKSIKALWKLYNNLVLQNGMTYQVDPDLAFENYCRDNNIIKEGVV